MATLGERDVLSLDRPGQKPSTYSRQVRPAPVDQPALVAVRKARGQLASLRVRMSGSVSAVAPQWNCDAAVQPQLPTPYAGCHVKHAWRG
eukprot:scaffold150769_cov34-Tisochrysis_lutea.AAC.2